MDNFIWEKSENGIPMYCFNADLWENLGARLCIKNRRIEEIAKISRLKHFQWRKKGDVRMEELISICNFFCIRISSFIAPDRKFTPLGKFVNDNIHHYHWEFHPETLRERFGRELSKNEAQRELRCHWESMDNWTSKNVFVSRLLYLCNSLRWNLSDCLTDPTVENITSYMSRNEMELEILRLKQKIVEMRMEINNKNPSLNESSIRENSYKESHTNL